MARSRFQSVARRSGSRPNRGWDGLTSSIFTNVAPSTKLLVAGFVPVSADLTILRTVGHIAITSDQSGAVEQQIGAMGLIVVSDTAFAIGATAVPDPITDQDDDAWFVYQSFSQQGDGSVTSSLPRTYEFDSKAKRIVQGEGQTIAVVLTNANASHAISFSMNFRILSQLRGTR